MTVQPFLYLTINSSSTSTSTVVELDSYTWNETPILIQEHILG